MCAVCTVYSVLCAVHSVMCTVWCSVHQCALSSCGPRSEVSRLVWRSPHPAMPHIYSDPRAILEVGFCEGSLCSALCAVQRSAVRCSAVQCSAVQCSAVQCSAVQCSAVYVWIVKYRSGPLPKHTTATCGGCRGACIVC